MEEDFSIESLSNELNSSLIEYVKSKNIQTWFPVQKYVIPKLLSSLRNAPMIRPRDLAVCSPTGSGKTLAFMLPLIQFLSEQVDCKLRALVLLPGMDLATQVYEEFCAATVGTRVRVGAAIGLRSADQERKQIFARTKDGQECTKVDVLIATPGKLYELLHSQLSLLHVRVLLIDEADRILNSPLEHDFADVLAHALYGEHGAMSISCACTPSHENARLNLSHLFGCAQTTHSARDSILRLLFTATLSRDAQKLRAFSLFRPKFLCFGDESTSKPASVSRWSMPVTLKHKVIHVPGENKPAMLAYLVHALGVKRALCFTNARQDAHRLCLLLRSLENVRVEELSANVKANVRRSVCNAFEAGEVNVLVCSDIVARGIDLKQVSYVINYDVPLRAHTYVHRSGRTARGGESGSVYTLVDERERGRFRMIWRHVIGRTLDAKEHVLSIDKARFAEYEKKQEQLLGQLQQNVRKEKAQDAYKRKTIVQAINK